MSVGDKNNNSVLRRVEAGVGSIGRICLGFFSSMYSFGPDDVHEPSKCIILHSDLFLNVL